MSRDGIAAKNEVVVSTRRQWPQEQKLAAEVDAPGRSMSQEHPMAFAACAFGTAAAMPQGAIQQRAAQKLTSNR